MASDPLPENLSTAQVLARIFRASKYGLAEFADLKKPIYEILKTHAKAVTTGRKSEVRYFIRCSKRNKDIQVLSATSREPEEIVRQLWLYRLTNELGYPMSHVEVEYPIVFGTTTADKPADILVFEADGKTVKIVVELKKPDRKDGIPQLKSYLNAEGSPVGVWSNGHERVILYRPYPREFEETLTSVPAANEKPVDVLKAQLTLADLVPPFDFRATIQQLEELVLANAGQNEFNEIFKLIFAKLFDEYEAKDRPKQRVLFRKSEDADATFDNVNRLFKKAIEQWPGIFDDGEVIKLTPQHLQVVVPQLEKLSLLGADMRVMDDAFEYLIPGASKKKKGQFFTPRYVIDMCVKMMNPTPREYVIDPACGSAGFLIHTMEYAAPASNRTGREERKHRYAAKYLWGIDFGEEPAKVARASMLIAGDGESHVFKANSLDPREWFRDAGGESLRNDLRDSGLLARKPPTSRTMREAEAWDYLKEMKFDVVLTNPPFAGEIRDKELLRQYELASSTAKGKRAKEERDVLFLERCLQLLKPGGRLAIVLPQGKLNNASLAYIRDWIYRKARVIAVVGLHQNTFKPHTGTKTSVLFLQKHDEDALRQIAAVEAAVAEKCPNYEQELDALIKTIGPNEDLDEARVRPEVVELLAERFADEEESAEQEDGEEPAPTTESVGDIETLEAERDDLHDRVVSIEAELEDAKTRKDRSGQTRLRAQLKQALRMFSKADEAVKMRSVKGRVQLLQADTSAIRRLREKWIGVEIAKQLDYKIFLAVSDRGGKNASGEYINRVDREGNALVDKKGRPLVDQDCVQYRDEDPAGIAEKFVEWAKTQKLSFWSS